ncbi:MAG: TetR/AcrR family transcriptional regulator [Deltaproteobacteria bacterium]|nr:TetR/AcrR family transcriptional regulator [Candidatus Zymogenaceae bacterium]
MPDNTKKLNDVQKNLSRVAGGLKPNRDPADKRERIIAAAERIFAQKGYFETTVAEIARDAQVAEGTIYEYFANKKDLLYAVPENYLADYANFVLDHLQGIKGALNKLRKIIWCHLSYFRNHKDFTKIMTLEIRIDPDYYRSKTYENLKLYSDLIIQIITEGIKDGEIGPHVNPHIIRDMILGTIEHVSIPWLVFDREIPIDNLVEDVSIAIFIGLAPREKVLKVNLNGLLTGIDVKE